MEESTSPYEIIKRGGKMWLLPKWINFSFIHLNTLRIIIIHFYKSRISEKDISSTITCYFIQYFISTVSFWTQKHLYNYQGKNNLNQIEKLP